MQWDNHETERESLSVSWAGLPAGLKGNMGTTGRNASRPANDDRSLAEVMAGVNPQRYAPLPGTYRCWFCLTRMLLQQPKGELTKPCQSNFALFKWCSAGLFIQDGLKMKGKPGVMPVGQQMTAYLCQMQMAGQVDRHTHLSQRPALAGFVSL